jgi:hypothetical protein
MMTKADKALMKRFVKMVKRLEKSGERAIDKLDRRVPSSTSLASQVKLDRLLSYDRTPLEMSSLV